MKRKKQWRPLERFQDTEIGYLTCVVVRHSKDSRQQWSGEFRCRCGVSKVCTWAYVLRAGTKASCGCRTSTLISANGTTHGMHTSTEYSTWKGMRARCTRPTTRGYHNYGGRGIKVCDRWMRSFQAFYKDMGPKPKGATLDRINVDGDYEPGNCRWATRKHQARNRRNNRRYELYGESYTLVELAEMFDIHKATLSQRLEVMSLDEALFTPIKGKEEFNAVGGNKTKPKKKRKT